MKTLEVINGIISLLATLSIPILIGLIGKILYKYLMNIEENTKVPYAAIGELKVNLKDLQTEVKQDLKDLRAEVRQDIRDLSEQVGTSLGNLGVLAEQVQTLSNNCSNNHENVVVKYKIRDKLNLKTE